MHAPSRLGHSRRGRRLFFIIDIILVTAHRRRSRRCHRHHPACASRPFFFFPLAFTARAFDLRSRSCWSGCVLPSCRGLLGQLVLRRHIQVPCPALRAAVRLPCGASLVRRECPVSRGRSRQAAEGGGCIGDYGEEGMRGGSRRGAGKGHRWGGYATC